MILVAGPCVIESKENLFKIANDLKDLANRSDIDFYFKASFDKANRTSIESFRGYGLQEGLRLLEEVKKEFGYKLLTDVHESIQIKAVAEVVDVIQIPAFLCRQTDLLLAAGETNRMVNIKKGQFMSPADMKYSVLKVLSKRGVKDTNYEISKQKGVWLTERGTTFGYNNLIVDMRSLVIMREFAPVIFDATHSVQMPGAAGGKSGGDSRYAPILARAAAAVGVDGFFMETHFDPSIALSDGPNMLKIDELYRCINSINKIQEALNDSLGC